jgi:hypothetical protein
LVIIIAPLVKMAPPAIAVLPEKVQLVTVVVPWLKMAPPSSAEP